MVRVPSDQSLIRMISYPIDTKKRKNYSYVNVDEATTKIKKRIDIPGGSYLHIWHSVRNLGKGIKGGNRECSREEARPNSCAGRECRGLFCAMRPCY